MQKKQRLKYDLARIQRIHAGAARDAPTSLVARKNMLSTDSAPMRAQVLHYYLSAQYW